jgi:hypothetical protein
VIIVDIIISANDKFIKLIKEIPLNNKNKVNHNTFQEVIKKIAKDKASDDV